MKKLERFSLKKILSALAGVFLIAFGVAFNNCAGLGNDPVGIIYDGIRVFWGMTGEQLGMVSNVVNLTLVVVLFIIGRKYISIGTVIYFLPYGTFVSLGSSFYAALQVPAVPAMQILFSVLGCLLLCMGVAVFIAVNIGVDPFTGIVLIICDRTQKEYRFVKILFDVFCILIGTILGGKLGVVTVVTALAVGPVIQFFTVRVKKYWLNEE